MPEANPQSDEESVAICLTSNKEAFGVLVERYEKKLRSYIRRIAWLRPEDTEDLLQIIFLKVWQNLRSFKTDLKFSSWIYRIAHNETLTYVRNRRSKPEGHSIELDEDAFENIASEIDIFKESGKGNDARTLRDVLAKLPPDQYDVIVLKFFEEKSYDEISDILTIPPGTVATRINRAKAKIKEIMSNNGYIYE